MGANKTDNESSWDLRYSSNMDINQNPTYNLYKTTNQIPIYIESNSAWESRFRLKIIYIRGDRVDQDQNLNVLHYINWWAEDGLKQTWKCDIKYREFNYEYQS